VPILEVIKGKGMPRGQLNAVIRFIRQLADDGQSDRQLLERFSRGNADGTQTPLTMPNHRRIKGSTLRTICTQVGIARNDFAEAYRPS
jgi:hypothetical protein